MRVYRYLLLVTIVVAVFVRPSAALVIEAGKDFYQISTNRTSTIQFNNDELFSGAGQIAFTGNPVDTEHLYGTSIVFERKQDATVNPGFVDSAYVNLEIDVLSLKSVAPVNGYNIYITLNDSPSTGVLGVDYGWWDEEHGNMGGYWFNNLTLSADVYIAPSGYDDLLCYYSSFQVGGFQTYLDAAWSDLRTNQLPSTGSNFFAAGGLNLFGQSTDVSVNIWADNTIVPEPASFVIMALGAVTFFKSRRAGK
jgi:hypothetical protein